ncbi:MAG TPA: endolytic transglycosylase MltG, partial [Acidimicrobiia bacterium]|nr:endolytic transglycosylase MltG [Acidimicrobiia bacterium]
MSISRRRRIALVIVGLVIVPALVLGGGAAWFWFQVHCSGSPGAPVKVKIEHGWGVPTIAKQLSHQKVIDSPLAFELYARLRGHSKFDAGTYQMHEHICDAKAIQVLGSKHASDEPQLTVPPGFWISQVADRVSKIGGRSAEAFMIATKNNAVRSAFEPANVHNLEGLIWPDT